VLLLPHVASATQETRQAMAELTLANLAAGLAGDPLPAAIV
jgi:hydroxypyruvate reductase